MYAFRNNFTPYKGIKKEDLSIVNILIFLVFSASNPGLLAGSDIFLVFIFIYCLHKAIYSSQKFDKVVLLPIFIFTIINALSVLQWGGMSFELLSAFIGYNMKFLIAYFFLKYLTSNFFEFYHRAIFVVAIISLVCWSIQVLDFDFFHNYLNGINMVPSGDSRNRWSCLVYTAFLDYGVGLIRNSGFASEPAFFSFYLSFWLIIDLFKNSMRISPKFVIIAIIGLTTFSTTYYSILLLLFILIAFQKENVKQKAMVLLLFALLFSIFINSSFGVEKMSSAKLHTENSNVDWYESLPEGYSVGRSEYVLFAKINFLKSPIGHGLNEQGLFKTSQGVVIVAGSSLLNYIVQWGVIFIIFIPLLFFRFWKTLYAGLSWHSYMILIIISFIWFYSGFNYKDPLFFTIVSIGLLGYIPISAPIVKDKKTLWIDLRYVANRRMQLINFLRKTKNGQ